MARGRWRLQRRGGGGGEQVSLCRSRLFAIVRHARTSRDNNSNNNNRSSGSRNNNSDNTMKN